MATAAVDEEEDVLTCSVCLDSYTDPCTLQCKHSFCRRCITDYVKTQADVLPAKTIPCPSCRQVTRVPDPSRPVDEWAGQLEPGHVVQELMAQLKKDSLDDSQLFQRQQLGELTPGTFSAYSEAVLCQRCGRTHSVMPISCNNELCDINNKSRVVRRKVRCKEHKDQLLQLDTSKDGDEVMGGGKMSSVRFSQQEQHITEALDSLHIGEIVTMEPMRDPNIYPVLSGSLDTRVEQDEKDSDICDVTILEEEGVHTTVVTDTSNNCVKSFCTKNNKIHHSRFQLDSVPCCITQLGNNKVMVAVPDSNQIVTVAVTPDLVYVTHINTSKSYNSLAVMTPSILAAGGDDCVDILNMQGEVMKSVELFEYPWYMCINNTGHLLVSDWLMDSVTCLTTAGQTVWIYSCTVDGKHSWLRGITTTGGGDILVADSNLKKVIQLSESGEYVRDVLTSQDGLSHPHGICVDKHGSLYICDSGKLLTFVFGKT